jgi:hypothetical protein
MPSEKPWKIPGFRVVEWDNARYREIERARRMLRGVVAPLTELDEQAEVPRLTTGSLLKMWW